MPPVPALGLIADDLTGALDAGAPFVRAGLRAALPFSGRPADAPEADVVLLNTESREGHPGPAEARARGAAEALRAAGVARVYKKIDSALRGHPGPELLGVLAVYGGRAAVAPAFPAQGRVTRGGVQYVHGLPAPAWGGDLRAALGPAGPRCDLFDATSEDDLARIALLAAQRGYRVWCGTAGLAAHVAHALGLHPAGAAAPGPPRASHVLVVAGSLHDAAVAQVATLAAAGWTHLTVPLDPAAGEGVGAALAGRLAEALGRAPRVVLSFEYAGLTPERVRRLGAEPDAAGRLLAPLAGALARLPLPPGLALVLTGGETALRVARALGARDVEVTGEALPGVPLGVLRLPEGHVAIATKSGGFGGPQALLHTVDALLSGGGPAPRSGGPPSPLS